MTNEHFQLKIGPINSIFTLSNINENTAIYSAIASVFYPKEYFTVDTYNLVNSLDILQIDCLYIFYIAPDDKWLDLIKEKKHSFNSPRLLNIVFINQTQFVNLVCSSTFNDINRNSVFLTHGLNWAWLICLLKTSKIALSVSGGSGNKRHVLSKLQSRLNTYMLALVNLNYPMLNAFNEFDTLDKVKFLPFVDFSNKNQVRITNSKGDVKIVQDNLQKKPLQENYKNELIINKIQKRDFHTSTRLLDKKSIVSYLDDVEEMLKNEKLSKREIQEKIEVSWIDLMKEKLEDPNNQWSTFPLTIKRIINTIENHNKAGIIKKRFKPFNNEFIINKSEIILLSLTILISYYNKISAVNLSIQLGEKVTFLLFRYYYKNSETSVYSKLSFEKWKINMGLDSKKSSLKLGDYLINLFTNEPTNIFEIDINDYDSGIETNSEKILKVDPEYIEMLKENLIIHPNSLPMICEPNEWSDHSYGGFLENVKDKNELVIGSKQHGHQLDYKELLYNAVNYLNKVKFSVNTDLLNYITNEGKYLLNEKSLSSSNLHLNITLRIAKIYSNSEFYLNVNSDWRSRIYTNSFFLTYQGGDLSRSLIQFYEGEVLTESGIKYLYICGANYYGSGLNKKSFNKRIEWINKNKDKIVSLDRSLIDKSDNKIKFVSFCLIMRKLELNKNAIIRMPVFLDATCSGLQHLAAMLKDQQIGALVNLVSKTDDDDASDIYTELVDPINKAINKYGIDKTNNFPKLSKVKLNRIILKVCIMTQVYNVKVDGIYRQLTAKFERKIIKNKKHPNGVVKYLVPDNKSKLITMEYLDVYKMAEIIKNVALDVYPSLRSIYNYFMNSTKLMIKLNIPIIWFTPAGLKIKQSYHTSITEKITLSYFGKSRTSVIKEWTDFINKNKQSQSIIPNIIHSYDASHLINVINNSIKNNITPVITIHDCYGTHPNNMEKLAAVVRNEFILLYSKTNFLEKHHQRILDAIADNNLTVKSKDDKDYVITEDFKKYLIPKPPLEGNLDLEEINKANLMIS